jgi:hypothetical protein
MRRSGPIITPSDPGIALLELFAFLGENLLYRFNQIPETARLEFLQLLQVPLRPAQPARALVVVTADTLAAPLVPTDSELRAGPVAFTVATEVRALPLEARAVAKAKTLPPGPDDNSDVHEFFQRAVDAIGGIADDETLVCYKNAEVDPAGDGAPVDFGTAVDGALWLACLAVGKSTPEAVRTALATHAEAPLVANIGFVPDPEAPTAADDIMPCPGTEQGRGGPAVEWQIASGKLEAGQPLYRSLRVLADTTRGLTQAGVIRLALPRDLAELGPYQLDDPELAGTGQFPPALDDETTARVVFWLRAFRPDDSRIGKVAYVGLNAAEAVQLRPARAEYLGTGTGQPHQRGALVHKPVLSGSLTLEVEEDGWRPWLEVDGFHHSNEGDRHYMLDAEAGEIRFGDGVHGLAPQIGQRIRARVYQYGGGIDGNVAASAISRVIGVTGVKVKNPFPASGGAAGESIAEALDRIPGELRRRDRAVTAGDFAELARMTPGADIGRAECLPRFYPRTRRSNTPGVVSVVVWPREDRKHPDAPTPDRATLRSVCAYLDRRRLVTTELFVIPPTYRKIAVSVGLQVQPGHGIETVRRWVELALRQYLAPLPPYGPTGQGWPLGRRVHGPELEAAALQVEGVEYLESLEVAGWDGKAWSPGTVELALDEVPELVEITVVHGHGRPPGETLKPPVPAGPVVPIPMIREEC